MTPKRREPDMNTYAGRFGARIRELRKKAGLTLMEMEPLIGVTHVAISRWECGERFPNVELIPTLAAALKLKHVKDLFPD